MRERWDHIASVFQRAKSIVKVFPFARLPERSLAAAKWFSIMIAGVAFVVVTALLVLPLSMRRAHAPAGATSAEPVRSLPLTLAGQGGRLSVGWDGEAPAIRAGECGVLWISDGGIRRRVILDMSQLRAGKLFYWPVNKDVSFEIQVSEGTDRSGEPVCGSNALSLLEPAESPAGREPRANRRATRNRRSAVQVAGGQSIESRPPEEVRASEQLARVESPDAPEFAVEGESQLVAVVPVHTVQHPAAGEKPMRSTALRQVSQGAIEPYSTVTVESVTAAESRLGRVAGKIPVLRRLHRTPEFQPPRPIRETAPTVPAELRRTLKSEVPVDVRAYIDESGKVTYAEMLSNINETDRGLATMAVFDARHWEFKPAQLAGRIVPGQVILHYRFGNPLLAISRDQR